MENAIKGGVSELVNDSTDSLPDMLGVAKALDSMGNFSLNTAGEETLEDLAHSEEGEVHV